MCSYPNFCILLKLNLYNLIKTECAQGQELILILDREEQLFDSGILFPFAYNFILP
jgi:hypothetical protein